MTVEVAIRARLLTLSSVTTLVTPAAPAPQTPQIFSAMLPQDQKYWPAIVVKFTDENRGMHLRGPNGLIRSRVTVESLAKLKDQASAVDAAVDGNGLGPGATGLLGWAGSIGTSPPFVIKVVEPAGKRDDYIGEEVKVYRIMRDYFVEYFP